ncbi:MAG: hypothetical protein ACE5JE_09535 [Thermoplasmata archaeon]
MVHRAEDTMSNGLRSRLRRMCLAVALLLIPVLLFAQPVSAHLEFEPLEIFVTLVGNSTADPYGLFYDKSEIILGPPPLLVTVTLINGDFVSNLQHDFTTVVNGTSYATPLLQPGEAGTAAFWINETGRIPYWCSVAGHREDGMEGSFAVTVSGTVERGEVAGPAGAPSWAYLIGLIGIVGMIVSVIIGFFLLRYVSRRRTGRREHGPRGPP